MLNHQKLAEVQSSKRLCIFLIQHFIDLQKLLKATRVDKVQSEFEMIRCRFVSYLEEMFSKGLQPPHAQPFHEIVFFSDVASVRKQIVGSPRGALHTALSNPVHYLQVLFLGEMFRWPAILPIINNLP